MELKVTRIGDATVVVLPQDVLARLKVGEGDSLFLADRPSGAYITPHPPHVEEQVQIGREFMSEYRKTFEALAK